MALQLENSRVQDLIRFLNAIDLLRGVESSDRTTLGMFWMERDTMKLILEQQSIKIKSLEGEIKGARSDQ